jgi:hypothetical protein
MKRLRLNLKLEPKIYFLRPLAPRMVDLSIQTSVLTTNLTLIPNLTEMNVSCHHQQLKDKGPSLQTLSRGTATRPSMEKLMFLIQRSKWFLKFPHRILLPNWHPVYFCSRRYTLHQNHRARSTLGLDLVHLHLSFLSRKQTFRLHEKFPSWNLRIVQPWS